MKNSAKGIITSILLMVSVVLVFGQKGIEDGSKYGHGEDSVQCITNISLYREYFKQDNYKLAYTPWLAVYNECPKAREQTFKDGIDMLQATIKKTEDPEEKAVLVDSMLNMYKRRIEFHGEEGLVYSLMGIDFIKYSDNTIENMQRGYDILNKAIELRKNNAGPAELVTYLQTSSVLFKQGKIEGNQVVNDFANVMAIVDYKLDKNPDDRVFNSAKGIIEKVFESSDAASCDNLIDLYAPKFAENPEDLELVTKIYDMLSSTKCEESDLYKEVAEQYNELEPSASLAYELANIYSDKEKYNKANKYYLQAIELQEEDEAKANYYMELCDLTFRRLENYELAKSYALKAAELNPETGYPYILMGLIYISGAKSCFEDPFEIATVYWAAVDKFQQAKKYEEVASKANDYIETYSAHFPDKEEIFFHTLSVGKSYDIGCWINETTTVRAR